MSKITELVDAFQDATWKCTDYCSIHDYPEKMDAAKTALLAAVAELERAADSVSIIPEDDGDYNLDMYADKNHTVSVSINKNGKLSWAGIEESQTDHGLVDAGELGKMMYRIAARIDAARQVTDPKESGQ
jgi:hypothetical protein